MYNDITGVVLAGGKSLRMGVNKSFLKFRDSTIIEHILKLMKDIFEEVIIISNTPEEFALFKLPIYKDIYLQKGPLAGIHSGLIHAKNNKIFVLSCDIPLMSKEMIKYIIDYQSNKPVKICRAAGYLQPLVGVYSNTIIDAAEKILSENEAHDKSLHKFLKEVDTEIISPEGLDFYKDEIFFNVNSPEDYNSLIKK